MDTAINRAITRNFSSPPPQFIGHPPLIQCQRLKLRPCLNHGLSLLSQRRGFGVKVERTKLGSWPVVELEGTLNNEMNPEERAQWMSSGILREKCGERTDFVETLECLEREAIMGEDQGKEPNDYNRRAQIFDKSSRVFQALKELSS